MRSAMGCATPSSLVHSVRPLGKTPLARPQTLGCQEECDPLRNSEAACVVTPALRKPRGWAGCLGRQERGVTRKSHLWCYRLSVALPSQESTVHLETGTWRSESVTRGHPVAGLARQ